MGNIVCSLGTENLFLNIRKWLQVFKDMQKGNIIIRRCAVQEILHRDTERQGDRVGVSQ